MALVSVKGKYQVVIPRDVREAVGVEIGDLLEAKVEAGKITLTPTSAVDCGVAESLADFAAGRSYGPFNTTKDLVNSSRKREDPRESQVKTQAAEMTASYSKRFVKQYAAAPAAVRQAFDKQVSLLLANLNHPSLHAKKYNEAIDLWQGRVNRDWRFISRSRATSITSTRS